MQIKYPTVEALSRLKAWCDRQERCHQEVRDKLKSWGYFSHDAEQFIAQLIEDNYLNEERFARAYVSGKYRIKKWGRRKIIAELCKKNISNYCIKVGLKEIDEEEYLQNLTSLITKKNIQWKRLDAFARKGKVARFCINKGYEPEMVWRILEEDTGVV